MAHMSLTLSKGAYRPVVGAPCTFVRPAIKSASRQPVKLRAEQGKGGNELADKVDEAAKDLVDYTKKSSGLDEGILGQQPGNRPAATGEASEVLSFSGLLPETINGRAAMFAMLAAFGAEVRTHQTVFQQIQTSPILIGAAFVTIIVASIIPVARKADLSVQGAGPFSQQAEIWNGRLAMVAFALLITVETWKAGPGLVP